MDECSSELSYNSSDQSWSIAAPSYDTESYIEGSSKRSYDSSEQGSGSFSSPSYDTDSYPEGSSDSGRSSDPWPSVSLRRSPRDDNSLDGETLNNGDETKDNWVYGTDVLKDISWNMRNDPSTAEVKPKVDLSDVVFKRDEKEVLELDNRSGITSFRMSVNVRTIHDVLAAIHEFYRTYEDTAVTNVTAEDEMDIDQDNRTYTMDDLIWFEGLIFVSPGEWWVLLGS